MLLFIGRQRYKTRDILKDRLHYESTVTSAAANFACSTTSSIGVSKASETRATPILRYGREVGFPKMRKSVLGNAAIFSIPEYIGFPAFAEAKMTALAPHFSSVISNIGRLKMARRCNSNSLKFCVPAKVT